MRKQVKKRQNREKQKREGLEKTVRTMEEAEGEMAADTDGNLKNKVLRREGAEM